MLDVNFYTGVYEDVDPSVAQYHWSKYGINEGRLPSVQVFNDRYPAFDWMIYARDNPDIQSFKPGRNMEEKAMCHYFQHGVNRPGTPFVKHRICFVTSLFSVDGKDVDMPGRFQRVDDAGYFLFTNIDVERFDTDWDVVDAADLVPVHSSTIKMSRYPKFMSWKMMQQMGKEYDFIFYCDSYLSPRHNVNWCNLVTTVLKHPFCLKFIQSPHNHLNVRAGGIMQEMKAIVSNGRDSDESMHRTINFFKRYDPSVDLNQAGFVQNTCFGYKPTDQLTTNLLNEFWSLYTKDEVTYRDQPLWNFLLLKNKLLPICDIRFARSYTSKNKYINNTYNLKDEDVFFIQTGVESRDMRKKYVKANISKQQVKRVYFVVPDKSYGSSFLRAYQIKNNLDASYISTVITHDEIDINTRGAIFIWVKQIHQTIDSIINSNIVIYDVVDNYCLDKTQTEINLRIPFDAVIVNSEYMKQYFEVNGVKNVHVVHHHWDDRLLQVEQQYQQQARFGYIGSIASLKHSKNLLHGKTLFEQYGVLSVDADRPEQIDKMIVPFNCHLNIRDYGTNEHFFKTTAKIATASCMNHNIITTYDKAVMDILPRDYPFIIDDVSIPSILKMMKLIETDFHQSKQLWKQGLNIMKQVKHKLSIDEIIKQYHNVLDVK